MERPLNITVLDPLDLIPEPDMRLLGDGLECVDCTEGDWEEITEVERVLDLPDEFWDEVTQTDILSVLPTPSSRVIHIPLAELV